MCLCSCMHVCMCVYGVCVQFLIHVLHYLLLICMCWFYDMQLYCIYFLSITDFGALFPSLFTSPLVSLSISFFLFLSSSFSPPPRMCVYDTLFLNVRVQESGIIHNKDQVWACQKIYLEQLLPVRKQGSGITEVGAAACFQSEKKNHKKFPGPIEL